MLYLRFFILLNLLVFSCFSYKVLIFNPAFAASHSSFLGNIAEILIDAGNEVTMLIPVYSDEKKHLVGSEKVTKIVRIGQAPKSRELLKNEGVENVMKTKIWTMKPQITSFIGIYDKINTAAGYQCEHIFQETDILNSLRNESFDLAISESMLVCGFAVFDHIGIKTVINADSVLLKEATKYSHGEPASTSYFPSPFSQSTDKMSFWGRVENLGFVLFSNYIYNHRYTQELESIRPYYKRSKTWKELLSNVAFSFINSNRYLDYPRATLPKTVFVGGLQVKSKKTEQMILDKEWDDLLNLREFNVLVSFGSIAHSSQMPVEFKNAFLEVFATLPNVTFIWKYEEANATLADHLNNVKLTTWMPQTDLLADPRLSLFVTHGGLGSIIELAYTGKPAVCIPLCNDQPRSANMLSRFDGSIVLHKSKLNDPIEIRKAIEAVLYNKRYSENAKRLAQILEDQPYAPRDVVLKHCDFAVAHGKLDTLDSEGRHLNTVQFYNLDIALVAFFIIVVSTFGVVYLLKQLLVVIHCIFTISNFVTIKAKKA